MEAPGLREERPRQLHELARRVLQSDGPRPAAPAFQLERVVADLRNRLFRHLERLSMGYYERNRTGDTRDSAHIALTRIEASPSASIPLIAPPGCALRGATPRARSPPRMCRQPPPA